MNEKEQLLMALNRAYYYLKFRPRSIKEMREYLEKKEKRFRWDEGIVEAALADLIQMQLLDDKQFIEYIVQRNLGRPKAVFVLKRKLRQAGVEQELVDNYFADNEMDEEAMARKAVGTRWRQWDSLDRQKRFQKLAGFLSRRGFRYDIVKKVFAKLEEEE